MKDVRWYDAVCLLQLLVFWGKLGVIFDGMKDVIGIINGTVGNKMGKIAMTKDEDEKICIPVLTSESIELQQLKVYFAF